MTPRPGFHAVTPRLLVGDVSGQVEFLRRVFGATGAGVLNARPSGHVPDQRERVGLADTG
jgi:hypothetical protein